MFYTAAQPAAREELSQLHNFAILKDMTNAQAQPLLYEHICADPMNADFAAQGWPPVYSASASSRIIIVGQVQASILGVIGKNEVATRRN